jgi:hypothetical protein
MHLKARSDGNRSRLFFSNETRHFHGTNDARPVRNTPLNRIPWRAKQHLAAETGLIHPFAFRTTGLPVTRNAHSGNRWVRSKITLASR